jgi:hypothetical protein
MNRYLLIITLGLACAGTLYAGDFADAVKDLGDKNLRPGALETLAKAGDEAFSDLLDGLKQDPEAEGVDEIEAAARSRRREDCARLLGALGDTRASGELAQNLAKQAVESPSHPWFGGTCAGALGRIWGGKPASAQRTEIVNTLKAHAGNDSLHVAVRWGALHGLAYLKDGGEVAAPFVSDSEAEPLLRSAAIDVVVAAGWKSSADALLGIWETQRFGPKDEEGNRSGAQAREYTGPLGLQALFGLAGLGDARAVPGLVDVCTRNEFASYNSLRDQGVGLLKTGPLQKAALSELVDTFKDINKPTQRSRSAQALGEFGAAGVKAFLDVADDEAPEGQSEDYYKKQVDMNLSSLRGQDALKAFVEAFNDLPAEEGELRGKIIDHLLNNRTVLKDQSLEVFRHAADDEGLEAPKRAQAINAWAESKGKESFDDLGRWVTHEDGVIRAQAVQNLGRNYIPLAKSRPLLEGALKDKGEGFDKARENALQGLQRSDDKTLLPHFTDSLDPEIEPSATVRNAALKAIDAYRRTASIEDDKVYPAIKGRVTDTNEDVRATAIRIAATTAQRMGNKTEAVEIIENALQDDSKEVRLAAYGQVAMVQMDIDKAKLRRAALLEEERDVKGRALSALSRLNADDFGDDIKQKERIVDLAFSLIEDRLHLDAAKTLLGKIGPGVMFNYVSDKARKRIEDYTSKEPREYANAAVMVQLLIPLNDMTYFKKVEELADIPNTELRRACVEYIEAFGTKSDVAFLQKLRDKSDAPSPVLRPRIEEAIKKLESK